MLFGSDLHVRLSFVPITCELICNRPAGTLFHLLYLQQQASGQRSQNVTTSAMPQACLNMSIIFLVEVSLWRSWFRYHSLTSSRLLVSATISHHIRNGFFSLEVSLRRSLWMLRVAMLRCSAHCMSIARRGNDSRLLSGKCNRQLAYCAALGSNEFVCNIVLASRHNTK